MVVAAKEPPYGENPLPPTDELSVKILSTRLLVVVLKPSTIKKID